MEAGFRGVSPLPCDPNRVWEDLWLLDLEL